MNSHQNATRITDVVPANFLCDNQTMQRIAESQVSDEKALSLLEENLFGLKSRQRRLKDELESVERLILEAVTEQTRLRSSIETHKSLLAHTPVRTLPGEVLSEIFLHYIAISQPTGGTVFQEIVAYHRTRARILQVCRRWRTTALADPRLWTTIPLIGSGERFYYREEADSHDEEEKSFTHPMISGSLQERAEYWQALESRIKRTSSLPLQLLLHFNGYLSIANADDTVASLKTFIRLFPRADTISLRIRPSQGLPKFASIMGSAHIPHTDRVHTARVDVEDEVFGRKIVSAIPNVEMLETTAVNIDQWFIGASTAGHCLRSLHLLVHWSSIPLVHLLDLLDRAPLLETLKLGRISTTPPVPTHRVVTHPLLSTFHLLSVTAEANDAIFAHLTLPALRSFSFEVEDGPYYWPRPSNLSFLQRSHCDLTELTFCDCLVEEQRLVAVLTAQTKVTTLQLNLFPNGLGGRAPIPKPILDFLSSKPKGVSDRPLPALTVLTVSVLQRQLNTVKRLIRSRSAAQAKKSGIATLRDVDIRVQTKQRGDNVKKDEHAALFKEFTDEGMAIRISYSYI